MGALRRGAEEKIGGEESGLRLDFPFSKGSSGPGVHRGDLAGWRLGVGQVSREHAFASREKPESSQTSAGLQEY